MDSDALERELKLLLVTDLGLDAARVAESTAATPLIGRGIGMDSVESMVLAAALERRFDIRFADHELTPDTFADLGSLARAVAAKLDRVAR
jgi:acyl carrier protein